MAALLSRDDTEQGAWCKYVVAALQSRVDVWTRHSSKC